MSACDVGRTQTSSGTDAFAITGHVTAYPLFFFFVPKNPET